MEKYSAGTMDLLTVAMRVETKADSTASYQDNTKDYKLELQLDPKMV